MKKKKKKKNRVCPHCNQGMLIKRKGKFGKFLSCQRYPKCLFSYAGWSIPKKWSFEELTRSVEHYGAKTGG